MEKSKFMQERSEARSDFEKNEETIKKLEDRIKELQSQSGILTIETIREAKNNTESVITELLLDLEKKTKMRVKGAWATSTEEHGFLPGGPIRTCFKFEIDLIL